MPILDKGRVAKQFSRAANTYDAVTPVQRLMGLRLLELTTEQNLGFQPARILELGCGTGGLTELLRRRYPHADITAIEISSAMVDQAQKRPALTEQVEFVQDDAEQFVRRLPPGETYDLIIANATVQWFTHPREAMMSYRRQLSRRGIMSFSTFGPQTFHELRAAFLAAEQTLGIPHQERFLSLPDVAEWRHCFPDTSVGTNSISSVILTHQYPNVKALLAAIRNAGASVPYQNRRGLSKSLYQAMMDAYQRQFAHPASGVTATYHLIYIVVPATAEAS